MISSPPKILIVDDEKAIAILLQHILEPQGYDVRVTNTGIEALYLLAQEDHQLMITDINMPQMDGLELTRRALEAQPDLAIILTTAGNNRDRAYQAYQLGASGYLLKPFDPNEIRIYVANTLRLSELELAHKNQLAQLEGQVQKAETQLKRVVSQLRVVLWSLDREGRFTLSEGRGLKDLGLQPGQVVGQSALTLYAHLPAVQQTLRRALNGEAFTAQAWVEKRLYENHYAPIRDDRGELNGTICLSIDISETHHLHEEIDRKARLASLGELAAGVAHEINNPNALVLLNSRALSGIFADISPILAQHFQNNGNFKLGNLNYTDVRDDLPQLLEHISDSAQRIKSIVSELRSFASGEDAPNRGCVDLNQLIRSALPFIEPLTREATEQFSIVYTDEPLWVDCIPKRLEQVVINLLQNSCHALTDKSAKITLSLAHDAKNHCQILKVEDEGCGISKENLERIKEPFFTTRRNSGGTGLGLSVSARMVEECAGRMEFESTPGLGTTAILTFPAAAKGDPP